MHPGTLIRWGALGTVVLLVRAIVREAQRERAVILLPPAQPARTRRGGRKMTAAQGTAEDWEPADEPLDEAAPAAEHPVESGGEPRGEPR